MERDRDRLSKEEAQEQEHEGGGGERHTIVVRRGSGALGQRQRGRKSAAVAANPNLPLSRPSNGLGCVGSARPGHYMSRYLRINNRLDCSTAHEL